MCVHSDVELMCQWLMNRLNVDHQDLCHGSWKVNALRQSTCVINGGKVVDFYFHLCD